VPVIAHFMGMATSGGYYVAMAADEIVAEPTNVTGSIGVILVGVDVSGLMEKFGVTDQTITGGRLKDAGSPLRTMTPEERAIFQSVIDDLHARFRTVVAAGRPKLSEDRVLALSDGRIFSAPQALENGLIDSVGSIDETVDKIERRLGVSEAVVVTYHRRGESRRNLYTRSPSSPPGAGRMLLEQSAGAGLAGILMPGFHYLWWPGAPR
jgi:protease-4